MATQSDATVRMGHNVKPITFTCADTLPLTPPEIMGRILDLSRWPDFTGFGPLPGVLSAAFEIRTPGVVGTRIRVTNTDGSSHCEEVIAWEPSRLLKFAMTEFAPPISRLSSGFVEAWELEVVAGGTRVARSFELHPTSALARPVLWLISGLLARAVARHLRRIREAERPGRSQAASDFTH